MGFASFLSSFIPGMGQILNNQPVKGIIFFIAVVFFFFLFFPLAFIIWFVAAIDALIYTDPMYKFYPPQMQREMIHQQMMPARRPRDLICANCGFQRSNPNIKFCESCGKRFP
ncbi:MAG: hypothetical protein HeimC2_31240 [Candidatus Heimdallarchaeota archaeon LC_2]|nr:MAG: hypothetical protein HeimC2_31240 [Candidatus Heimdallarchaeota archaeon LC_2]